jgi:hypothetical protein
MKETEFSWQGGDPFPNVHLKDQAENAKIILLNPFYPYIFYSLSYHPHQIFLQNKYA